LASIRSAFAKKGETAVILAVPSVHVPERRQRNVWVQCGGDHKFEKANVATGELRARRRRQPRHVNLQLQVHLFERLSARVATRFTAVLKGERSGGK
jgi:hypothetical protein